MSDSTPVTEVTPPSASADQPSSEPIETVESLKEKLAAEQADKEKALEEAKRWKNRVKEDNPPKKVDPDEAYSDWRIDNANRIKNVKDEYEKELSELQESGSKLSIAIREKALQLAEKTIGVKTQETEPLPSATVDRSGQRQPILTDSDVQFGVKPETKKKYAHLVEG